MLSFNYLPIHITIKVEAGNVTRLSTFPDHTLGVHDNVQEPADPGRAEGGAAEVYGEKACLGGEQAFKTVPRKDLNTF